MGASSFAEPLFALAAGVEFVGVSTSTEWLEAGRDDNRALFFGGMVPSREDRVM